MPVTEICGKPALRLARFLHKRGMTSLAAHFRKLPVEDRIDQLSRWMLVLLLLATLACLI
jgi:hypothetical protein